MQISKKELERMYYGNTNKDVCQRLGISTPTLIDLLKRTGIKLKGKGQANKIEVV